MRSYWLLPKASRTDGTVRASSKALPLLMIYIRSGQATPWGWHLMSYSLRGSIDRAFEAKFSLGPSKLGRERAEGKARSLFGMLTA